MLFRSGGFEDAAFVFQAHLAFEDQGEFVELWALAGFGPAGGAAHVGDAGLRFAVVHGSDVFVDDFVAGDGDLVGLGDELGHANSIGTILSAERGSSRRRVV